MTPEEATDICKQSIAVGKALRLKFDERFPPNPELLRKAFDKLVKENEELKEKLKIHGKEI